MFLPCHHIASIFDPCTLSASFQLAAALSIERELQDRRKKKSWKGKLRKRNALADGAHRKGKDNGWSRFHLFSSEHRGGLESKLLEALRGALGSAYYWREAFSQVSSAKGQATENIFIKEGYTA